MSSAAYEVLHSGMKVGILRTMWHMAHVRYGNIKKDEIIWKKKKWAQEECMEYWTLARSRM